MNTKIKSTVIAAAVAGLFVAQSAVADTLTWNGGFAYGSAPVTISAPISGTFSGGAFTMTDTTTGGPSFAAWCVDIFDGMAATQNYTFKSGATFYSADPGKATALSHLASNWLSAATTSASNSAAFQLAVWEIVNETSGGTYSLTAGNFRGTSSTAAVLTEANLMLANLTGTLTYTTNIWAQNTAHSTQDLAVFAPVPEPESYAMMLAGLGMMGFVARRRKQVEEV